MLSEEGEEVDIRRERLIAQRKNFARLREDSVQPAGMDEQNILILAEVRDRVHISGGGFFDFRNQPLERFAGVDRIDKDAFLACKFLHQFKIGDVVERVARAAIVVDDFERALCDAEAFGRVRVTVGGKVSAAILDIAKALLREGFFGVADAEAENVVIALMDDIADRQACVGAR